MTVINSKISIIVPVYNAEHVIKRCVDSLLKQSYPGIEIIIVNDGSTDQTDMICRQYADSDNRIVYIRQNNTGVSGARNSGICCATGEYVLFVDSDDFVESDLVDRLYEKLKIDDSDICAGTFQVIEEGIDFTIEINIENIDKILLLCRHYLIFGPTQKLYKKQIIDEHNIRFPKNYNYGEDVLFNLHYLNHSKTISFINHVLYHYDRSNDHSLSQRKRWDLFKNDIVVNKALKEWFENNNLINEQSIIYLSGRIFDTAYNGICLAFENNSPWTLFELPKYYRTILNDPEVIWSLKKAETDIYAKWIVTAMKKKRIVSLCCAALLKRLMK